MFKRMNLKIQICDGIAVKLYIHIGSQRSQALLAIKLCKHVQVRRIRTILINNDLGMINSLSIIHFTSLDVPAIGLQNFSPFCRKAQTKCALATVRIERGRITTKVPENNYSILNTQVTINHASNLSVINLLNIIHKTHNIVSPY